MQYTKEGTLSAIKHANAMYKVDVAQDLVWFTMIALKILRQEFSKDAPKYALVEKKAQIALRSNFPDFNFESVIKNLKVIYKPL